MTSRKRSRDLEDLDGEVENEDAGSHLRQSLQKRSRVAPTTQRGESDTSDGDDSNADASPDEPSRDGSLDSPISSDGEHGDEAAEEILAAEVMKRKYREVKDNIPSEQGIIEEVFCRNFMCHSKLRIQLGPLINFIIGHNGSGKSAVLTALQMCLGGKATATNRGASLKSLIKEGEDSATLAVKIKNQGEGAYKPDLYGDSITVERHFTRSGTSGFKLRNSEDKVITTKKADLDDILDFFSFQLDNPINVLTQDLARQFLSNSSASEKYKFFIRGTQLETLDNDYKILEEHLTNMEEKLIQRKEDVQILEGRAKDAEKKKKQLDDIAHVQARIDHMSRMHAWAQVEEQEDLLQRYKDDVLRASQQVQEDERAAETMAGTLEGHSQTFEAAKRSAENLAAQTATLNETTQSEKEKYDNNVKQLKNIKADQRRIKENMDKCKRNMTRLQSDIDAEHQRLSEAEGGAHAERLIRLEELKGIHRIAKETEASHREQKPDLEAARNHASEHADRASAARAEAKERLTRAETNLHQLERDQGRKYAGYSPKVEDLIREINQETRWRNKPVGPVGIHVRLLRPEWSSQIEQMFGGTLNAFLVTCKDDQNILASIMKRIRFQVTMFMGNPAPLDTTGKEPEQDVDTVMRVLRIDNDLVRNTLITMHYIEQTVLIKDKDDAYRYIYENPAGRPRNVRAVIAMASRPGAGIRYEFTGRGAQKSGNVRAWTGQARMKTDREQQLRIQRERLDQSRRDLDAANQEARHCMNELEKAKQTITRFERDLAQFRTQTQRAEEDVDATQNEIEGTQPQHGKLQELERQLEEARSELQDEQASYGDSVLAIDKSGQICRELKTVLETAQAELAATQGKTDKAEERQRKAETAMVRAQHEKNEAQAKVDTAKQHVTRLEEKQNSQQAKVDEFVGEAGKICARVPVEEGVTPHVLDERLQRLIEDRQRRERNAGGTREELTAAWHKAELAFREAHGQMHDLSRVATALQKSLAERHRRWGLFRKYISMRARNNFTYLLSERNFRGRVLLDHAGKRLDLSVEPDLARRSDAGRQARTLSGGEKSFATICLLLSIWEAMGSPVRCLDEFDVFMDSVNRSTSMTMMIQAARRAVGRQFILITPQAMNQVALGADVRIHRMSDPERGQGVLPFGEAA